MSITRNEFKLIKSYQTKKGRKTHQKFIAEGVRLLEESYRFQLYPKLIIYSKAHLDDRIELLIENFKKKDVPIEQVSSNDIKLLSDTKTPQGIIGIFNMHEQSAIEPLSRKTRNILWCENISDPGNVGTLIRSGLAFGFKTVCISGETADVYSPKVVRSTMGAIFKIHIIKDTTKEIIKLIQKNNLQLIAADMHGKPIHFVEKQIQNRRFVLAVGSEGFGLSQEIKTNCDHMVRIDHDKAVESLNVAVAGSVLMNEFNKEN